MSDGHHDIAIIGSGFSGLGMAHALKQEGREDFVVLEQAETVGGTWRDNTYPGIGCDVPTPLYSFSFAQNPEWSRMFAKGAEIQAYLEDCTDRFGLRERIRFGSRVTGAEWSEAEQHWKLEIADGSRLTARLVIAGIGGLTHPSYPEVEGLESFSGRVCHSAAWDHDAKLAGKRVAVIGTGASGVQIIPEVAEIAERLDVYQRTPGWIFPKLDRLIGPAEQRLYKRFPAAQRVLRGFLFANSESIALPLTLQPRMTRLLEVLARAHLKRQVPDPELRAELTPTYSAGCKRMLPSNDYYPALIRANVDLITDGIERISERGIVAGGQERAYDAIVLATGFDIEAGFAKLPLKGRGGRLLTEAWAGGIEAHRGTMISGFPNLMMLSGPNTGTGSTSQIYMIESQITFIREALSMMDSRGLAVIEPTAQAQRAYNEWLLKRMRKTVWVRGGCQSWYLDERGVSPVLYPHFSSHFRRSLKRPRPAEYRLLPRPVEAPGGQPRASGVVA